MLWFFLINNFFPTNILSSLCETDWTVFTKKGSASIRGNAQCANVLVALICAVVHLLTTRTNPCHGPLLLNFRHCKSAIFFLARHHFRRHVAPVSAWLVSLLSTLWSWSTLMFRFKQLARLSKLLSADVFANWKYVHSRFIGRWMSGIPALPSERWDETLACFTLRLISHSWRPPPRPTWRQQRGSLSLAGFWKHSFYFFFSNKAHLKSYAHVGKY